MKKLHEKIVLWKIHWRLDKFKDPTNEIAKALQLGLPMTEALRLYGKQHFETSKWEQNVALNEGIGELLDLTFGLGSPTAFDDTNGYLGVGDDNTGEQATDTGLIATTNELYKLFDGTYPQRSAQTVECRATFGTSEANFAWEEYTIANGNSDAAKNLNRKTASKGTKVSGETWTLSVSITPS